MGRGLAYVIYTSGSTGRPKGVPVTHGNVARLFDATEGWFGFGAEDVWTLFHSYAFDFSVWEIWGALLHGGRLVVVPHAVSRSPEAFLEMLRRERVTVLNQTPSAFYGLIRADELSAPADLALRYVVFGGEALDPAALRPWMERHGEAAPRLVNMYGITETTVHVTYREVTRADVDGARGSRVGVAIPDLAVYLLDPHGEPVPAGVPGEMCVGGAGVARGYLGRPELTAERFVPDPFSGGAGARLYRSGDLARLRPGGDLEYLGRIDQQVKVRGFRIEPGEVEAALAELPEVRECVVVARGDGAAERRLVGYVVPAPGAAPVVASLRDGLLRRLPEHMVPAAFVVLDALPLTANGKVDRRALPAPEAGRAELGGEFVAPRTDAERVLARVWGEVLGVDPVGARDNFFALGGDSIRSIRVVARAREEGLEIALPLLFRHQTVEALAAAVAGEAAPARRVEGEPFRLVSPADRAKLPADVVDAYPLTRLQLGMLFHSSATPGSAVYHDIFGWHVGAPLDEAAFQDAVREMAARHPVLRTSFEVGGLSEPLALVHADAAVSIGVEDVSALAPAEQDEAVAAWMEAEKGRGFDWAAAPLLRLQLHRRGEDGFQLTLSFHHAILDGWSVAALLTELLTLYSARLGHAAPLVPAAPRISFADYVEMERRALASDELRAAWTARVADAPARLPRDPHAGAPGVRQSEVPLAPGLSAALRGAAARAGVPLKSLLLAAHLRVVAALTGAAGATTGITTNGRPEDADGERVLGLFLNTLPLRVEMPGGTWAGLARAAFRAEEELLPLRRFPLAEVQRLAGGEAPFEAAFNYVHFHVWRDLAAVPGVRVLGRRTFEETSLPLIAHFVVDADSDEVQLVLSRDAAVLGDARAAEVAGWYGRVLAAAAADPDARYDALSPLSPAERERVLEEWNATAAPFPAGRCVHELFEAQAGRTPLRTAVSAAAGSLTYAELDARAGDLARVLRARGVGPDARVGICLERSPEMVVAVLGVLKAGSAYVPLDPAYPRDRLRWMLEDSGVRVVLASERTAARLPEFGGEVVAPSPPGPLSPASGGKGEHDTSLAPLPLAGEGLGRGPSPDNLAYVIYTSGSTGRPKGVMVPHRGVVNYLHWAAEAYGAGDGEGSPVHSSLAFDLTVTSLLAPLVSGGRVMLVPEGAEVEGLAETLRGGEDLTLVKLTPAHLALLGRELEGEHVHVRTFVVGGEALPAETVALWREVAPGAVVVNEYGPTETVVGCSVHVVTARDSGGATVPIGAPVANARLYVLDPYGDPAPVGTPGELCVGGAGVTRGYHGRPELTAERFVPDPFGREAGARLYRTGDRASWRTDGTLEYLGRTDEQVKVRGFRIEPGEVEAALLAHPAVRGAAVVAREDEPGVRRLAAYLVAPDGAPAAAELRAFLAERLPEYMVPATFVPLDALPLTPNGKTDRRALPAPEAAPSAAGEAAPVDARTDTERSLAEIWAALLRVESVGVHDNFFELGGDSILGIQVVARAKKAGIRLTTRHLFKHPTIAELAAAADAAGPAAPAGAAPAPAAKAANGGEVPLTPVQRWFFARELPRPEHYNQALLLEVSEPVDAERLAAALARVAERHDALGLRFRRGAGGWTQVHGGGAGRVAFERVDDASDRSVAEVGARLQAGMSLADGPLVRAALFAAGGGAPQRLLVAIHHLAVDAVSWRVLLEDLETAYRQIARGEAVSLPAGTTPFRDWAERLAKHAATPDALAELDHWLALADARPAPLPRDGDAANVAAAAREVVVALGEAETRALLQDVPAAYRTRIDDVLLAAFARVLGGWTGSDSVLVELEGHGREPLFEDVDLTRTVGWFTSIYPVRLAIPAGADEGALLKSVKEQLRAIHRRGVGFGVLRWLGDDATRARLAALPRPEVSFNYLGRFDAGFADDALFRRARGDAGPAHAPEGARSHLLEVNALVAGGRLEVGWTYAEGVHSRATVERIAAAYLAALRALAAHCTSGGAGGWTPSDFPLAGLDQAGVDRLTAGRRVEAVYPLSPMQQGMLFHAAFGEADSPYLVQLDMTLRGALDPDALAAAWRATVEAHSALRSAFVWEGLPEPLQVAEVDVPLPWTVEDWRRLAPDEREARLDAYVAEDRRRGFDLSRAPLMRFALFRTGEEEHRLLWTQHHLLLDGWSGAMVLREVLARHGGLLAGRTAEPPRSRPYRDFVAWLRAQDESAAEAFWREALRGFDAPTPLAVARPDGPGAGTEEAYRWLSAEATAALLAMARGRGLTLNTLVQGAWALLLARYAGQDDVVFGATVSGRPAEIAGVEQMVGLFINTLPVRARLRPAARVGDWLASLQEQQAEARRFEHAPLMKVQGWSDVPSGEALFRSLLIFENYPVDDSLRDPGAEGLWIADARSLERTTYPLTLIVLPGAALGLRLQFDAARFDRAAVARLLDHLAGVLAAFARDPGGTLDAVALPTAEERETLLGEWSGPARDYPAGTLHGLVAAAAERTPDALAVVRGAERWTYRELAAHAEQVAARLRRAGVGPEARVGVMLERTPQMVAALLGVLGAGGAYVPLDPAHPADRLAYVLRDSGARVLVTQESLRGLVPAEGVRVVALDADDGAVHGGEGEPPEVDAGHRPETGAGADNSAYVIYTSGSTGHPKGVTIEHRSAVNFVLAMGERPGAGAEDAFLALTTLAFDISVLELFLPLAVGARVVLADREDAGDGARLDRLLADEGVTVAQATPATWRMLLLSGWTGSPGLRVLCGGEALPAELAGELRARAAEVWNVYGPTEATVWATVHPVGADERGDPVAIGRPIPNLRAYVLDPHGNPVPAGVAGELHLGGAGLARGYLGRPGLTAAAWVPDPFSAEPGARLYRTGDRAKWRADGALEFLGRMDQQVKVRGFRIEPGEIEAALLELPAVAAAAVAARSDAAGDTQLVAYVVPADGTSPAAAELRARLRERLPEYMVPSAFVALEALPLSPAGKLDRRALPAPEGAEREAGADRVAPRTELEAEVARVWAEVLELDAGRVGVGDGFFESGGHSLRAMRLVSRIREALAVDFALPALFAAPTVEGIARAVEALRASPRAAAEAEIAPARRGARSIEEMLEELEGAEGLSDEEILALLEPAE